MSTRCIAIVGRVSAVVSLVLVGLLSNPGHALTTQNGTNDQATDVSSDVVVTINNAQLMLIDKVEVATRDAGIVIANEVSEGDSVTKGTVMVRLDNHLHRAEMNAAQVELEIAAKESENDVDIRYAEKSAAVNETVLKRSQLAADQYARSISQTELERLDLELQRSILSGEQAIHSQRVNRLNMQLKEERLRVAELRLRYRNITAPIDGVVAEAFLQTGEWASAGQVVARVINPRRLRVEALIDQKYSFKIKQGQSARFEMTLDGESSSVVGKVVFVSPEINPLNEEFLVWVEIDNSDLRFKPGLKGTLHLLSDE